MDDQTRLINRLAREAFKRLYEIHRPLIIGLMGMGSDAYAEAVGSFDIALDAVIRARAAAAGALKENRSREDAEIHAHEAALEVFNEARKNNQIFLNNGTRSATIVRAYMLSGNGL